MNDRVDTADEGTIIFTHSSVANKTMATVRADELFAETNKTLSGWFVMVVDGKAVDSTAYLERIAETIGANLTSFYTKEQLAVMSAGKHLDLNGLNTTDKAAWFHNLNFLTGLTSLSLANNGIQDMEQIDKLVNLTMLDLGNNHIQELAPLKSLTKLVSLNLKGQTFFGKQGAITDIPKDSEAKAGDITLNDIKDLLGLTNLKFVNLKNTNTGDQKEIIGQLWARGVTIVLADGTIMGNTENPFLPEEDEKKDNGNETATGPSIVGEPKASDGRKVVILSAGAEDRRITGLAGANADFADFLKKLGDSAIFIELEDGKSYNGIVPVTVSGLEAGKTYFLYHFDAAGNIKFVQTVTAGVDGTAKVELNGFSGYILSLTEVELASADNDGSTDAPNGGIMGAAEVAGAQGSQFIAAGLTALTSAGALGSRKIARRRK
jgi:hypothetical protein